MTDPANEAQALAERVEAHNRGRGRPPVHQWHPEFSGDIDMRIASDGRWYYQGGEIKRHKLVQLFAGVLRREADDAYYLVTPVEKHRIRVDDAPFVATWVSITGEGRAQNLVFGTNVEDQVLAAAEHPLWVETDAETGGPRPYLRVRDRLDALIQRNVFYELADVAVIEAGRYGVWSAGRFFELGPADG